MQRTDLDPSLLEIRVLNEVAPSALSAFSCGDADLDDFFRTDALRLEQQHVVRNFAAIYDGQLVAAVSLMADAVILETRERKRLALSSQDHPVIPALKIARLAVSAAFRSSHRGMGTMLIRFAHAQALMISRHVGCRLLTVDAYPESITFYEGLGFARSRAKVYRDREHPSMWLDILQPQLPPGLTVRGTGDADPG